MLRLVSRQAVQSLRQPLLLRSFYTSARRGDESELLARIRTNLKDAMRSKDNTASIWKSVLSAHEYSQKSPKPASLTHTLRKAYKQRLDSAAAYRAATPVPREDLAAKEESEAALLSTLLPPPVTPAELEGFIETAIETLRDKGQLRGDPGKRGEAPKLKVGALVKAVMQLSQGRVDTRELQFTISNYAKRRQEEGNRIE